MRSRFDVVARARNADIVEIAARVGAKLKRIGSAEWAGPCLVCGGSDRFSLNSAKAVWNCRSCGKGGDAIELARHVLGVGFTDAIEFIIGDGAREAVRSEPTTPSRSSRGCEEEAQRMRALAYAHRIVAELVPIAGTLGEAFLRRTRKIDTANLQDVMTCTDAVGWHEAIYFNEVGHVLHGQRLGCIVGVMTDPVTAKPSGAISRTYITRDLTKIGKAKTLGSPAGIVRLSPDDEVLGGLHIAEGIETALDAMSEGLRPIWATGSTSLMESFPLLGGIQSLTIIVDHDRNGAGERAARMFEAHWLLAGREVTLYRPQSFGDFNDFPVGFA
jgi:hypothetical protein